MKIIIIILSSLILISCSKGGQDNEMSINNPLLNLEITNTNSYSATFNLSFSNVENLKLIWNENNDLNINSKIGEKEIDVSNNIIIVNNLASNKEYFFRLYSHKNNNDYYSNIVSTTTAEVNIAFDNALISNNSGYLYVTKAKQIPDGFIIGAMLLMPYSDDTSIEIIKLDNNQSRPKRF